MDKYIKPSIVIDHENVSSVFPLAAVSAKVAAAAMSGAVAGVAARNIYARNVKSMLLQKNTF